MTPEGQIETLKGLLDLAQQNIATLATRLRELEQWKGNLRGENGIGVNGAVISFSDERRVAAGQQLELENVGDGEAIADLNGDLLSILTLGEGLNITFDFDGNGGLIINSGELTPGEGVYTESLGSAFPLIIDSGITLTDTVSVKSLDAGEGIFLQDSGGLEVAVSFIRHYNTAGLPMLQATATDPDVTGDREIWFRNLQDDGKFGIGVEIDGDVAEEDVIRLSFRYIHRSDPTDNNTDTDNFINVVQGFNPGVPSGPDEGKADLISIKRDNAGAIFAKKDSDNGVGFKWLAENIPEGTGTNIFKGIETLTGAVADPLEVIGARFYKVKGGTGITVDIDEDAVRISADAANTDVNIGGGESLLIEAAETGYIAGYNAFRSLQPKTTAGYGGIAIERSTSGLSVWFSAVVDNVGGKAEVFKELDPTDGIRLRTLEADPTNGGIIVTQETDTITFEPKLTNLTAPGAGIGNIFKELDTAAGGEGIRLRSLKAGTGVTLSENAADVTINSTAGTAITVEEDGTPLATAATTLNFREGVIAAGAGATKTIDVGPFKWILAPTSDAEGGTKTWREIKVLVVDENTHTPFVLRHLCPDNKKVEIADLSSADS